MRTSVLVVGFTLLIIANLLMIYVGSPRLSSEGFTNYYLENAGGYGKNYKPMGPFDEVGLSTGNDVSSWRYTRPNEPLQGPAFKPGPDSLFIFKTNQ